VTSGRANNTANISGATAPGVKSAAIKQLGGFELITKIGQGGMGSVFKARQISLDRTVAVKILPPSIAQNNPVFIERFIREARTSAKLNHPNVVQGIEVGKDEATGLYYFAMELVDGPTVKVLLKQQQRINEKRALEIIAGVTQALICAEKAGIVHRDVKPDNILLTSKGEVKLADLGLARGNFDANLDDASNGSRASVIGTPAYMAPEQIRGENDKFDVRTDLYALGGTFFHMVSGRAPYVGEDAASIMSQHLNAPIPNVRELAPELSPGVASVITRLLQKDPAKRFQTATDLAYALEAAGRGERVPGDKTTGKRTPITSMAPVSNRQTAQPPSKKGLYASVLLLVLSVAGSVLYLRHRAGTEPLLSARNPSAIKGQPAQPVQTPPLPPLPGKDDSATSHQVVATENADPKKVEPPPQIQKESPTQNVAGPATMLGEHPADQTAPKESNAEKKQPKKNENTAKVKEPVKSEPPLEEQALGRLKDPLAKLDIPAARAALKTFGDEKKLEPMARTQLDLVLDSEIESHSQALATDLEELLNSGKFDEAQTRLNAVKFSESGDVSTAEVVAKSVIAGIREKLALNKALGDMSVSIKQATDLDNVLLGVSAALDSGHVDQAAKWLDEAVAQPAMAPSVPALKRDRKLINWYADLQKAVEHGATELSDNRQFTLTLNDGRVIKVGKGSDLKFVNVSGDTLNLEQRVDRATARRAMKFETFSRETRYELSMLPYAEDKADAALLKLKWAYVDLSSMTAIVSKSAAILDHAERLISEATEAGAPAADVAAVQPWLARVQNRVRIPQKSSKGGKNLLLPYLPFIEVVSGGGSAGSRFKIALNGRSVYEGVGEHRGLNVVAVANERVILRETFDTSGDIGASRRFADAVAALPKNALVIVAVCEDAGKNFQDTALVALRALGAKLAMQGKPYRYSYYCIGMKGLDEGLAVEEMSSALLEYPKK
jgi:serine/threonine protein kinase